MQVHVNVIAKADTVENTVLDMIVMSTDTVSTLKDRIASLQLIPPGDHLIKMDDKVLKDSQTMEEALVVDGASLGFEVNTSDSIFLAQLTELLQARDLSPDELGLLYCYKHGISINQALKVTGFEGKFSDFLSLQKPFVVDQGRVSLHRDDTALKPFSVADEIAQLLRNSGGSMDVKDLTSKFVQKFNVSMMSITGMKPVEFFSKHRNLFTVSGRMVCLKSAEPLRPAVAPWDSNKEKQVAMPPPGLEPECVSNHPETAYVENQQYLDLHNRICGRSFNSKVAQTLSDIVEVVTKKTFLSIEKVVKGGSIAKGSAITGISDAEVVFFVRGVPQVSHDKWLPPLLRATCRILSEHLGSESGVDGISVTEDSVHMKVKGIISVDLRFSPVFETFSKVIQTIGSQGPEVRRHYTSSLVQERTQFIAKQPGHVKVTIRLLKWWRDQQEWSGKLLRPADEILELLAVYSAVQSKPADQRIAVANVMLLLSQFNDLQIVWSNYYSKDDVWSPLLRQRPLLMDPTNPFVNIADAQFFDAREMMKLAQTTRFFW